MEQALRDWQARLPLSLLPHVVPPVRVEAQHDAATPASKWHGYDPRGTLCWYRHHFAQWDADFGDDDQPAIRLLREEEVEAWRGHGGLWVRRTQRLQGDGRPCGLLVDSGFEVVQGHQVPPR